LGSGMLPLLCLKPHSVPSSQRVEVLIPLGRMLRLTSWTRSLELRSGCPGCQRTLTIEGTVIHIPTTRWEMSEALPVCSISSFLLGGCTTAREPAGGSVPSRFRELHWAWSHVPVGHKDAMRHLLARFISLGFRFCITDNESFDESHLYPFMTSASISPTLFPALLQHSLLVGLAPSFFALLYPSSPLLMILLITCDTSAIPPTNVPPPPPFTSITRFAPCIDVCSTSLLVP